MTSTPPPLLDRATVLTEKLRQLHDILQALPGPSIGSPNSTPRGERSSAQPASTAKKTKRREKRASRDKGVNGNDREKEKEKERERDREKERDKEDSLDRGERALASIKPWVPVAPDQDVSHLRRQNRDQHAIILKLQNELRRMGVGVRLRGNAGFPGSDTVRGPTQAAAAPPTLTAATGTGRSGSTLTVAHAAHAAAHSRRTGSTGSTGSVSALAMRRSSDGQVHQRQPQQLQPPKRGDRERQASIDKQQRSPSSPLSPISPFSPSSRDRQDREMDLSPPAPRDTLDTRDKAESVESSDPSVPLAPPLTASTSSTLTPSTSMTSISPLPLSPLSSLAFHMQQNGENGNGQGQGHHRQITAVHTAAASAATATAAATGPEQPRSQTPQTATTTTPSPATTPLAVTVTMAPATPDTTQQQQQSTTPLQLLPHQQQQQQQGEHHRRASAFSTPAPQAHAQPDAAFGSISKPKQQFEALPFTSIALSSSGDKISLDDTLMSLSSTVSTRSADALTGSQMDAQIQTNAHAQMQLLRRERPAASPVPDVMQTHEGDLNSDSLQVVDVAIKTLPKQFPIESMRLDQIQTEPDKQTQRGTPAAAHARRTPSEALISTVNVDGGALRVEHVDEPIVPEGTHHTQHPHAQPTRPLTMQQQHHAAQLTQSLTASMSLSHSMTDSRNPLSMSVSGPPVAVSVVSSVGGAVPAALTSSLQVNLSDSVADTQTRTQADALQKHMQAQGRLAITHGVPVHPLRVPLTNSLTTMTGSLTHTTSSLTATLPPSHDTSLSNSLQVNLSDSVADTQTRTQADELQKKHQTQMARRDSQTDRDKAGQLQDSGDFKPEAMSISIERVEGPESAEALVEHIPSPRNQRRASTIVFERIEDTFGLGDFATSDELKVILSEEIKPQPFTLESLGLPPEVGAALGFLPGVDLAPSLTRGINVKSVAKAVHAAAKFRDSAQKARDKEKERDKQTAQEKQNAKEKERQMAEKREKAMEQQHEVNVMDVTLPGHTALVVEEVDMSHKPPLQILPLELLELNQVELSTQTPVPGAKPRAEAIQLVEEIVDEEQSAEQQPDLTVIEEGGHALAQAFTEGDKHADLTDTQRTDDTHIDPLTSTSIARAAFASVLSDGTDGTSLTVVHSKPTPSHTRPPSVALFVPLPTPVPVSLPADHITLAATAETVMATPRERGASVMV